MNQLFDFSKFERFIETTKIIYKELPFLCKDVYMYVSGRACVL